MDGMTINHIVSIDHGSYTYNLKSDFKSCLANIPGTSDYSAICLQSAWKEIFIASRKSTCHNLTDK